MAKRTQPVKPQPSGTKVVAPRAQQTEQAPRKKFLEGDRFKMLILLIMTLVVNHRVVTYSYTYDDSLFTSENTLIGLKGISAIPELFSHGIQYNYDKSNIGSYRPLIPISFAIEQHFFGFDPAVSHGINLVLYAIGIAVLYRLLRRIFNNTSPYIPFFIALLFALHPIHTEVVANVKSRDEIMALLFLGLTMLQGYRYIDSRKTLHFILSGFFFLIALLCKESSVPFLLVIPLTFYFFTDISLKRIGQTAIPLFAVAVVYFILRAVFLDTPTEKDAIALTDNALMAAHNYSEKLGTILLIQLHYLRLLIFPHPQSYDYSYHQLPIVPIYDYRALLSLALIISMSVYAAINFRRKSVYAYCIIFYLANMVVTSNLIIDIAATMGERFLFTPALAFCIALVFLLAAALKIDYKNAELIKVPRLTYPLIVIACLYAAKTYSRNEIWKNNFALFTSGVETAPNSWRTTNSLAVEYRFMADRETDAVLKQTYYSQSIKYFKRSLEIYPLKGDTYADLGAVYFTVQKLDSAEIALKKALELKPSISAAAANLGTVYLTRGDFDKAIIYYRQAAAYQPDNVIALFNGAVSYYQVHKYDSAIVGFKRSLAVDPSYNGFKGFDYTAIVYKTIGNMDSAVKYEALARQKNPSFHL